MFCVDVNFIQVCFELSSFDILMSRDPFTYYQSSSMKTKVIAREAHASKNSSVVV